MDFSWLAEEAHQIHNIFQGLFYSIITVLILVGVFLEYFKIPLGGTPAFGILVSRAFIAVLMLTTFPEFLNLLAELVDGISAKIGEFNNIKLVLAKMGTQWERLSWSWTDIKQMVLVVISFITFFLLYVSVYLMDAIYYFAWTIPYIFSPLLIACYVIPSLSGITVNLYKTVLIASTWKLVWGVLATLLWSTALLKIDELGENANLLTLVIFNLMLAASLLYTPKIASGLFGSQFTNAVTGLGGFASGSLLLMTTKLAKTTGAAQLASRAWKPLVKKPLKAAGGYLSDKRESISRANKKGRLPPHRRPPPTLPPG